MSDFARQQSEFQRGILTGDDTILVITPDGPTAEGVQEKLLALLEKN